MNTWHTFYVSYQFKKGNDHGFGCVDITRNAPLKTMKQIMNLTDYIKEANNFDSVVIINWKELELDENNVPK